MALTGDVCKLQDPDFAIRVADIRRMKIIFFPDGTGFHSKLRRSYN